MRTPTLADFGISSTALDFLENHPQHNPRAVLASPEPVAFSEDTRDLTSLISRIAPRALSLDIQSEGEEEGLLNKGKIGGTGESGEALHAVETLDLTRETAIRAIKVSLSHSLTHWLSDIVECVCVC